MGSVDKVGELKRLSAGISASCAICDVQTINAEGEGWTQIEHIWFFCHGCSIALWGREAMGVDFCTKQLGEMDKDELAAELEWVGDALVRLSRFESPGYDGRINGPIDKRVELLESRRDQVLIEYRRVLEAQRERLIELRFGKGAEVRDTRGRCYGGRLGLWGTDGYALVRGLGSGTLYVDVFRKADVLDVHQTEGDGILILVNEVVRR